MFFYEDNLPKILSYNAYLNFIVTERGLGKTYGFTKFVIKDFLKSTNQFVYIRRYRNELEKAIPNFFDAIVEKNEFPDVKFSHKGYNLKINDEVAGFGIQLSTSQDLKSVNFSKVKTIIFDEAFIEEGQKKFYLKNEVHIFLNLIETIGRLRDDIRIFVLSNATNSLNPYFLYFNLSLPYGTDYKLFNDNLILLSYIKNNVYRETKKQTKLGRLVSGTEFEDYAINNKFQNELNQTFIEKKKESAKFTFAIIYKKYEIGVWFDYKEGLVYFSFDSQPNSPYKFAFSVNEHKDNTMLMLQAKKYSNFQAVIKNYELGNVRFENAKLKNIAEEILGKLINIR